MWRMVLTVSAALVLVTCPAWAGWNNCAISSVGVTGGAYYMMVDGCTGIDAIPDGAWYSLYRPFEAQQAEVAMQANLADRRVSFHLAESCASDKGQRTCLTYINAIYLVK